MIPTPNNTSPSGRYYDWKAITGRARKAAGTMVLAASDVPATAVYQVRQRRSPDLQFADGYLQAELRNRHRTEDGQVRGDLYVSFVRASHGAR